MRIVIVEQFGLAMIPRCPRSARRLISGITNGTSGSIRNVELLSITTVPDAAAARSEEHTSELQSLTNLVCRLLLEKKNPNSTLSPGIAGRSLLVAGAQLARPTLHTTARGYYAEHLREQEFAPTGALQQRRALGTAT